VVAEISAATQEQSTGLSEINSAVSQLDKVTQQNAAMVEETTAASSALTQEARELSQLTNRFSVRGQSSGRPNAGYSSPARSTPATRTHAAPRSVGNAALAVKPEADSWDDF
jgi:methyl-accepting chemotaxis protein